MSTVRTVLGDIDPGDLGATYLHEHLIIDHPLVEDRFPHISCHRRRPRRGAALPSGGAMVDAMPCARAAT